MKKGIILIGFMLINILSIGEMVTGEIEKSEIVAVLRGFTGRIENIEWSPDGNYIGCSNDKNEIFIWDVASGELLSQIETEEYPKLLKFSPDSKYIGYNKKIYRIKDGKCIRDFGEICRDIVEMVYSSDGKKAIFSDNRSIAVWSIETGEFLKKIDLTNEVIYGVALSGDGKYFAILDSKQTIKILELDSEKCIMQLEGIDLQGYGMKFKLNDRYIMGETNNEKSFLVWDRIENKVSKIPKVTTSDNYYTSFTENLKYSITTNRWRESKINIWEVATGKLIKSCLGEEENSNKCIAWSPDNRFIAVVKDNYPIQIWSFLFEYKKSIALKDIKIGDKIIEKNSVCLASEKEKKIEQPIKGNLGEGEVMELEKIKIYSCNAGNIYKDLDMKEIKGKINAGEIFDNAYYYKGDDKYYIEDERYNGWIRAEYVKKLSKCSIKAVIKSDGTNSFENIGGKVKYKYMSGDIVKTDFKSTEGYFYSENIGWILCSSVEPIYELEPKVEKKEKLELLKNSLCLVKKLKAHKTGITAVALSPNGEYLASADCENTIKIWDIVNENCLISLRGHGDRITMMLYSPDGRYLVTCSQDTTIKIWDIEAKKCIKTLNKHKRWIKTIAFSSDGKYLASGGNDSIVNIWDTDSWECIKTIDNFKDWIKSVAFSPDNKFLAVSSDDGILIELEIESKKVKEKLLLEKEKCKKLYYNKKGEKVIELLSNGEVIVVDGDNLDDKEISKKEYAKDMLYNVNNDLIISGGNEGINVIDMKEKIEVYLPESYCGENIVLANSYNGRYVACGNLDGILKLWQILREYDRAVVLKDTELKMELNGKDIVTGKILKGTVCLVNKEKNEEIIVAEPGKGSGDINNFEILDRVSMEVKENSIVYSDDELQQPIYKIKSRTRIENGYYYKNKNLYYIEENYFKGWLISEDIIIKK